MLHSRKLPTTWWISTSMQKCWWISCLCNWYAYVAIKMPCGQWEDTYKTQENYLIPFSLLVPLQNCMKTHILVSLHLFFYAEWGSERVNFCCDLLPFPLFCFKMFGNWVLYYNNCVMFIFFFLIVQALKTKVIFFSFNRIYYDDSKLLLDVPLYCKQL